MMTQTTRQESKIGIFLKLLAQQLIRRSKVSVLLLLMTTCAFGQNGEIKKLFSDLSAEGQTLMSEYMQSLDFAQCLTKPKKALQMRLAWNRNGHRFTILLRRELHRLSDSGQEPSLVLIIALLGGTQDDRAAIALKELLMQKIGSKTRWSIYAALAELGFYSAHYSGLLLKEVQKGHGGPDGNRKWDCALLLARIHQPEAVWAQNQLYKQRLVDGALSEMVRPLLQFRDLAMHLSAGEN